MRSLGRSSSFWLALVTSHFLASPSQVASHFLASPSQVASHFLASPSQVASHFLASPSQVASHFLASPSQVASHFLASPSQVASHFFASPSQITSHKNSGTRHICLSSETHEIWRSFILVSMVTLRNLVTSWFSDTPFNVLHHKDICTQI